MTSGKYRTKKIASDGPGLASGGGSGCGAADEVVGMEDETITGGGGTPSEATPLAWEGEVGGVGFNGGESRHGNKSGIAGGEVVAPGRRSRGIVASWSKWSVFG
jgi:hypothetical protein